MNGTSRVLGDRYEVSELLGRGGMAEVHAGRDQRLGRRVAIKLLRADMARDPVFQARFRREAQSTAGLNHPSIVAVYDTGEDVFTESGGAQVRTPYIVMEYVEGQTVRDLLDEAGGSGLGTQRAVEITTGVLTALQAAHAAGIVHRDVKPANVMVTPSGGIKVMDFGIARAVADSSATMTQTSAVIGTAQYLSPEQARGEVVDARTDLYSTGCLLYELLTGRPPFVGDSPVAVAYQHVGELPQPPSRFNRAVDDELDRVVLKALAKQRDDRYADAAEFREDLLAAEAGHEVMAPTVAVAHAAATQHLPTTTEATRAVAAGGFVSRRGRNDPTGQAAAVDAPVTGQFAAQPEPRRGSRVFMAVLVVVLLVVLLLVGWLTLRAYQESTMVTVPTVVGQNEETARGLLRAQGLSVSGVTSKADPKPSGIVIDSTPQGGSQVKAKSSVALVVSSGPAAVQVPEVAGQTQEQAAASLRREGLTLGDIATQDIAQLRAGTVISTDPPVGSSVAPQTAVNLTVASGKVAVTNVVTKSQEDAVAALTELGLVPSLSPAPSDQPLGTVLSQTPERGVVAIGSVVQLVISGGPTATQTPSETTPSDTPTSDPTDSGAPPSPSQSPSGTASGTPTQNTSLAPEEPDESPTRTPAAAG
ncbi:serine/threonine protein kinase [Quadrisphaera granulorum]|uniref:non-specific serine/threonine protein kinase n=1 Tax=Quadrisphaera granulorum TaxID=317664 RepID=A0A316AD86_9ACTN|nr:Stk1 family PASTA domain-containing Ser/Thr kinase [Quadrisphaera granulorum]PWJ55746.1 serine/threonine-protein kinase [Quadrisphaera granulorum]SZE95243.1 serine/threonine protein kinase [Quadrisphaera granulorum]